jgi:hypothetical protein
VTINTKITKATQMRIRRSLRNWVIEEFGD